MKILLIGHRPYVTWIYKDLEENGFLKVQDVDLMVVEEVRRAPAVKASRFKAWLLKFGKLRFYKLRLRFGLRKGINQEKLKNFFNLNDALDPSVRVPLVDNANLFDREFLQNYDRLMVASYGGKLPSAVFESPRKGTWNIHPSVLPQLKGGYPTVVQALDTRFLIGTTIHEMTERIDEGRILGQKYRENKKSQPNHVLFRQSATDAAKMLKDWLDSNMEWEPLRTPDLPSSTCKEYFKPDWYIGNYTMGTDINSLVNAFSIPHMFPFIYGFSGFKLVQILSVGESTSMAKESKGIHFRNLETPEKAELVFYSQTYQLLAYILDGKIYQR
jgi:methionyl-tRNA formyltransferase